MGVTARGSAPKHVDGLRFRHQPQDTNGKNCNSGSTAEEERGQHRAESTSSMTEAKSLTSKQTNKQKDRVAAEKRNRRKAKLQRKAAAESAAASTVVIDRH